MNLNLTFEEEAIQALKIDLGISSKKAHCLDVELWRHAGAPKTSLQCRISLFTDDGRCIQGGGANFGDAAEDIRHQFKPKTHVLNENEEVRVITPEPES